MAIATYAQVIASIRDWLARPADTTTLPDNLLADLVVAAETEIYDRLRVRDMEASAALTVSAQSVALPSDFMEIRRLYLDGTPLYELEYVTPPQFWLMGGANTASRPTRYTIEGNNILFGLAPDATYTGRLLYYARPAALSTATNAIFTARPTLFLYGALKHAAALVNDDDRIPMWASMFEAALKGAQAASDRSVSGAPLRIRVA
jgi:hypothetical protein